MLGERQHGEGKLYLIRHAFLSLISALSKSPQWAEARAGDRHVCIASSLHAHGPVIGASGSARVAGVRLSGGQDTLTRQNAEDDVGGMNAWAIVSAQGHWPK